MESEDSDIGDMLDDLLANADPTETEPPVEEKEKTLKELKFNFLDSQTNTKSTDNQRLKDDGGPSVVHEADLDSSDDEDKRNFEDQKYSDCGRDLKNLLKKDAACKSEHVSAKAGNISENQAFSQISQKNRGFDFNAQKKIATSATASKSKDNHCDPVFGINLIKPLISSGELVERMRGRTPVSVSKVKNHIATENIHNDWVIAGVLINRSTTKTSAKGSQYCIWKLSDLGEKMNTVSLFLFSGAYKLFWKTTTGTVVGILNPSVMDSKDDVDQATLSVDNAQKVMVFGNSRDMAKCKSTKKNGEPCSNIVNLSRCEYCVYHVKQEYNKASRRADIQSNASGRGFSSSLAPKSKAPLAGIYAQGGQNFVPVLAKRNEKLYAKDSARLALLRGGASASASASGGTALSKLSANPLGSSPRAEKPVKKAASVELTTHQVKKDLERLNKLRGWNMEKKMSFALPSETPSPTSLTSTPTKASPSLLTKASPSLSKASPTFATTSSPPTLSTPRLGAGVKGGSIDFSQPITKKHVNSVRLNTARLNAARWIKENSGALKQSNPNKIRESKDKLQEAGAKRRREAEEADVENERVAKKAANGINDKFKEIMEAKSAHVDLVEKSQDEEQDKYFGKLELKERMEEKMLTTFKVDCKAVKCIICKYTSFSASDFCKQQKHPLRVIDATKSFFKCSDCGNRTVSLDRIPSHTCKKCSGSHWVRAAMMDEKRTDIKGATLSIRGGEETFIGSVVQDANLNLLVPDSGT